MNTQTGEHVLVNATTPGPVEIFFRKLVFNRRLVPGQAGKNSRPESPVHSDLVKFFRRRL